MSVRVSVNRAALSGYLNRGVEPQKAIRQKADTLKLAVDDEAAGFAKTGYHLARTYVRRYRYGYQVVNGDPFSFMIEYGTRNNRAYAPLRRAAQRVFGDDFRETSKSEYQGTEG